MSVRSLLGKFPRLMFNRNEQHRLSAFEERMTVAREIAAINPQSLPSLVRLIGRRLQADAIAQVVELAPHVQRSHPQFADLFFDPFLPITADGKPLDDLIHQSDGPLFHLHLGRDLIVPGPWNRDRTVQALAHIGTGKRCGPWTAEWNHRVVLYLPIGLALVYGGNHSLTAGIANGEGTVINRATLDMGAVYDHVRYNGISYRRMFDDSEIKRYPNSDAGTIFEIGRLMLEHGVFFDGTPATKAAGSAQEARDR